MYEENTRSLRRYDINTLQPIPRVKLIPRAQLTREVYGLPPSRPSSKIGQIVEYHEDEVPNKNNSESPVPVEETKLGKMISVENAINEKTKIQEGNIGSGRFFFLFQKYPALVAIIVSLLLNYGQRYNSDVKYLVEERVQIIMSLANGILVAVGSLHGIQNHNYSFIRAKFLSIIKIPHLLLTITAAAIQLVYSVLSYIKLKNNQDNNSWLSTYSQCDIKSLTTPTTSYSIPCYNVHDRIVCSCILMGCAISIIILGLFSFASLLTAYINHKMDVDKLKERQARHSRVISAYTNQTAFESTL
uniref:MARVEL domain-containing protein n=1 Tax=Strongyloides venezuelensis TaxID=75913 RepID=A0A0K0FGZ2_STRVS